MARAARSGNPGYDVQDDVLGRHARAAPSVDGNAHRLGFGLQDTLRGENHLYLRRTDAECDGAESPVRRRMAVAADDRHTRLRNAQLGAHDMHDPVTRTAEFEILDSVRLAVATERFELHPALLFGNRFVLIDGRHVMVGRTGRPVGTGYLDSPVTQTQKGHGRGHLVDIVAVDIQHAPAPVQLTDRMSVPYLVKKSLSHLFGI